jgi:two-component system response regulator NreC
MSGIEVCRKLRASLPHLRVLILTLHEDTELLREAIQTGASGYIIKRAADIQLVTAVHAIQRDELYVHPALVHQLICDIPAPPSAEQLDMLTPRETEVFELLAQGYTNRQIADELCISIRTAEGHRANIMDKLELSDRAALVRFAEQCGLYQINSSALPH